MEYRISIEFPLLRIEFKIIGRFNLPTSTLVSKYLIVSYVITRIEIVTHRPPNKHFNPCGIFFFLFTSNYNNAL